MFLDLLRKSLLSIGGWGLAPKFSTDDTYSTRQQIPRSRRTRDFDCPILQAFGSPLKNRKPRWRAARSVEEPKTTLASGTTPRDEGTRYNASESAGSVERHALCSPVSALLGLSSLSGPR